MRLFKTILLLMLVASLIPTSMVGLLSVSDARRLLIRDAQELAQERVKQLRLRTEVVLQEPTRAAMGLARVPRFFSLPVAEQRAHISALLSQSRDLLAITLFSPKGERLAGLQAYAVNEVSPSELAQHELRARALVTGLVGVRYSPVAHPQHRSEPTVTLAFPVGEPVKGIVAAELALTGLSAELSQVPVGSSGVAYVIDRDGRLVASTAGMDKPAGEAVAERAPVQHLLALAGSIPGVDHFHVGNFGEDPDTGVVAAYSVLAETGWGVVSEQPLAHAYVQVETLERRLLFGVLGALAVAVVLAAAFSQNLTRPLKGFMAGALQLAKGSFGVQVTVKQKNELGELAQTFNYMSQQLQAYDAENRALYENLEKGYLETIVALANSIDSKDAYTRGHSQRVGDLAMEIGRELGLTPRELKQLHYGGILHDIGKIGIAEPILCKQSRLTDEEMAVMRGHPEIGDQIIDPITFLGPVRACIRSHHERWDGSGYPDKLAGEQIPLVARIVACSDTFDACTSTRPYQKAMPLDQAMEIMEKLSGKQLDPNVVDALKRVVEKKGVRVEGHRQPVKLAS